MKSIILLFFICVCFKTNAQNIPGIALNNFTFIEEDKVFQYQDFYFFKDTTGHWMKVPLSNVKAITSNIEAWPDRGGYYNDMQQSYQYFNSAFNSALYGAIISVIGSAVFYSAQNPNPALGVFCLAPGPILGIVSFAQLKKGINVGRVANIKMTAPEYTGRK